MSPGDGSSLAAVTPLSSPPGRAIVTPATAALMHSRCIIVRGPTRVGKSTLGRAVAAATGLPVSAFDARLPQHRDALLSSDGPLHHAAAKVVFIDQCDTSPDVLDRVAGVHQSASSIYFVLATSASRRHGCVAFAKLGPQAEALDLTPITLSEHSAVSAPAASVPAVDVLASPIGSTSILVPPPAVLPLPNHWLRGGFPESLNANDDAGSLRWRQHYVAALCNDDYAFIDPSLLTTSVQSLLQRVANLHGSVVRTHLSPSEKSLVHYLCDIGLLRLLQPWTPTNPLKGLEREPRIYIRDSGLLHALLGIGDIDQLLADKACGNSWEGYCIEQLLGASRMPAYFYRANNNEEIDLILKPSSHRLIAIEFKVSKETPKSGFHTAASNVLPTERYLVTRPEESYDKRNYRVMTLPDMIRTLHSNAD